MNHRQASSPLSGIRVVELAGIGPGPFACTMFADLGCDVTRITRVSEHGNALPDDLANIGVRGRATIAIDLKSRDGQQVAQSLIDNADIMLEAFRPGVAERLGVGPERFKDSNPGLVYVRLTGWGHEGPYASMAGHDINYIGLTGALASIGGRDRPIPPLNLLGDYAGGSLFAVVGALSALVERSVTGQGRVVDVAMVDGISSLLSPIRELAVLGLWSEERASNMLDGGAPFYRTYRTADGSFMAVGALEPAFYSAFVEGIGLVEAELPDRFERNDWPELESIFAERFESETRDHWQSVFDGTDACVTPVLTMSEAPAHPHYRARWDDDRPRALAPVFDGVRLSAANQEDDEDRVRRVLVASGLDTGTIDDLQTRGVIDLGSQ